MLAFRDGAGRLITEAVVVAGTSGGSVCDQVAAKLAKMVAGMPGGGPASSSSSSAAGSSGGGKHPVLQVASEYGGRLGLRVAMEAAAGALRNRRRADEEALLREMFRRLTEAPIDVGSAGGGAAGGVRACYGAAHVLQAWAAGAVKCVLVSEGSRWTPMRGASGKGGGSAGEKEPSRAATPGIGGVAEMRWKLEDRDERARRLARGAGSAGELELSRCIRILEDAAL